MNLLALQRRMSEDVRRPLTADFAMQAETEDGQPTSAIAARYVKPNSRLTSFERLEIYNRQYWFRVTAALAEDFPALSAVLSRKRFDTMVLAYLRENPSTSFTLRNLGAKLPQWLAAHPEFAPRNHRKALDVARLEWAYVEAFDGAAIRALGISDLQSLNAESTLCLQPHLQLLDLLYPVDELVLAVHKNAPHGGIASNGVSQRRRKLRPRLPGMRRSAIFLAVHRYQDAVYYRRIDRQEFLMLVALKQEYSLAAAIDAAFAGTRFSAEERARRIREYFAHASELGWFCLGKSSSF